MPTQFTDHKLIETQALETISKTLRELANLIDALALASNEQPKAKDSPEPVQLYEELEKLSENKVYTLQEACEYLRINRNSMYTLLNSGKIKGFRIGKLRRFTQKELDGLINSL